MDGPLVYCDHFQILVGGGESQKKVPCKKRPKKLKEKTEGFTHFSNLKKVNLSFLNSLNVFVALDITFLWQYGD